MQIYTRTDFFKFVKLLAKPNRRGRVDPSQAKCELGIVKLTNLSTIFSTVLALGVPRARSLAGGTRTRATIIEKPCQRSFLSIGMTSLKIS